MVNNISYEGGSDVSALHEYFLTAWHERPELKTNFGTLELYLTANRAAFEAQRVSESTTIRELMGRFSIVTTP